MDVNEKIVETWLREQEGTGIEPMELITWASHAQLTNDGYFNKLDKCG